MEGEDREVPHPSDYVELRCASAFSFLAGASNPEDLVDRAAGTGHHALALADRDGLYGIPRFHQAAQAAGLAAIVGARVRVLGGPELLLLVETARGHRHLARLLTAAHAKGGKHAPRFVTWDELETHAGELVALVRGDATLSAAALDRVRATAGAGRTWVDVSRHLDRRLEAAARRAAALAEACGVPVVASNDVRHARAADRVVLDVLTCLREKTSSTAPGGGSRRTPSGT